MLDYFKKLTGNQLRALWFVVPLLLVTFVFLWPSAYALILLSIALLIVFWVALFTGDNDFKHTFEGLAAVLSSIALVLAGYWFFIERRSVPKATLEPSIQLFPVGEGMALARVELLIENVGNTAIEIEPDDFVALEIGQVMPAIGGHFEMMKDEFRPLEPGDSPLGIMRTDIYSPLARLDRTFDIRSDKSTGRHNDQLAFKIEAGETEKRYFKALIPCVDGLVASVRVEVPKKMDRFQRFMDQQEVQHVWRAQSISNTIENC